VFEEWHKTAVDVQGGPDASSSSENEDDDEIGFVDPVMVADTCVCKQCR